MLLVSCHACLLHAVVYTTSIALTAVCCRCYMHASATTSQCSYDMILLVRRVSSCTHTIHTCVLDYLYYLYIHPYTCCIEKLPTDISVSSNAYSHLYPCVSSSVTSVFFLLSCRLERLSPEAYSAYTTETPISDVTSDYSCSVSSTADSYMSGGGGYTLQQPCGIAAFRCHAKRTMDTYGMVVYGLDELDAIYPLLKSTGRRLARKGVQAQHLQVSIITMLLIMTPTR